MTSLQVLVHVSGKLGTEQPLSSVPKLPHQIMADQLCDNHLTDIYVLFHPWFQAI